MPRKTLAGTLVDAIADAEEVSTVALEKSARSAISGLQALGRGRAQERRGRLGGGSGRGMELRSIVRKIRGGLMNHALELTAKNMTWAIKDPLVVSAGPWWMRR